MTALQSKLFNAQMPPRWQRVGILTFIVPIAFILIISTVLLVGDAQNRTNQRHHATADQTALLIQNSISAIQQTMPLASPENLDQARTAHPAIQRIAIIGLDQQIVASSPAESSAHLEELAKRTPENTTGLFDIGEDVTYGVITGTAQDGRFIAEIDLQALWTLAITAAPDGDHTYLVTDAGLPIVLPAVSSKDPMSSTLEVHSGISLYRGLENDLVIGQATRIPNLNGYIVTETPIREFGPLGMRVAVLWLTGGTLTVVASLWRRRQILKRIIEPIDTLRHGSTAFQRNDYGYRIRLSNRAEPILTEIAQTYNEMAGHLQVSEQRLAHYDTSIEEIVDQRARELSRKTQQLETANSIARELCIVRRPHALAEQIARQIRNQFNIYHVEMLVVDPAGESLFPLRTAGIDNTPTIPLKQAETNLSAWAVRHKRLVYVPDVTQEPRFQATAERAATQCALVIPLQYDDTIIGLLNLESDHRDAFPRDAIAVLETLAGDIALALHNAQVFDKQETANSQLAQATLHMQQANLIRSRFLLSASQRLRTRLSAILTETEAFLSGVHGTLPESIATHERTILNHTRQLQALVNDMVDLSTIESGSMELSLAHVSLPPLLTEVTLAARALQQTVFTNHDLEIVLDSHGELPQIRVDITHLRHILMALLSNAIRATEKGDITIRTATTENAVTIQVIDTGPGIPAAQQDRIFDAFKPGPANDNTISDQTGLGLPLARLLAQLQGGDLTIVDTSEDGTTFELSLPIGAGAANTLTTQTR